LAIQVWLRFGKVVVAAWGILSSALLLLAGNAACKLCMFVPSLLHDRPIPRLRRNSKAAGGNGNAGAAVYRNGAA
jgi:hypothetical protein